MGLIKQSLIGGAAGFVLFAFGFGAIGQETKVAPQEGPTALSETYQDWVVNCQQVGAKPDGTVTRSCQMIQELSQKNNNQRVLLVSIVPEVDGAVPRATIIAPFGLKLSQGLGLFVGDDNIATAPFATCLPAGCVAYLDLDSAMLDTLQKGEVVNIVSQPLQSEEPLVIAVSLAGFTAAWKRLNAL